MKKAATPTATTSDQNLNLALSAMKQTLDSITGSTRSSETMNEVASTATLADVIKTLNIVIRRLK